MYVKMGFIDWMEMSSGKMSASYSQRDNYDNLLSKFPAEDP